MAPTPSFAPLAARLAARADEICPADGAEAGWDNFMALLACAILQMLIILCEALDARALADAGLTAAPATRDGEAHLVVAARPRCEAMRVAGCGLLLARAPVARAMLPKRDDAPSGTAGPVSKGTWLAWVRPAPSSLVAGTASRSLPFMAVPPRKAALRPAIKHAFIVTIS